MLWHKFTFFSHSKVNCTGGRSKDKQEEEQEEEKEEETRQRRRLAMTIMMKIKMAMIMMTNDLEIVEGAEPIKHLP